MFLEQIDSKLFRPLSSVNARIYGIGLYALYNRLVKNQLDVDECTPKEAKEIIRLSLVESDQHVDWGQEQQDWLEDSEDGDDAGHIYRYLRDCGWLREIDDVGYRRVTYIPRLAARLLAALEDISGGRSVKLGTTCRGVYRALRDAERDPLQNASQIEFAAGAARVFFSELNALVGSCREIAQRMTDGSGHPELFYTFFKEFLRDVILGDYSELKTQNHPLRYRSVTVSLAIEISNSPQIIEHLVLGLSRENRDRNFDAIRDRIHADLTDIIRVFEGIDGLLIRIEHYRRSMTRRAREAMDYSLSVVAELGSRIDDVVVLLATNDSDQIIYPSFSVEDVLLCPERHYQPRVNPPEPTFTEITYPEPDYEGIARSRVLDLYLGRRSEDPIRIKRFLEEQLQERYELTSDDMTIENLDDFLAYIQLRDLINNAVPFGSPYEPLLRQYRVSIMSDEITDNEFLSAPKIRVERLNVPSEESKNAP